MTTKGAPPPAAVSGAVSLKQQLPARITPVADYSNLSMDRRSVAAHPWHDLEIGESPPTA